MPTSVVSLPERYVRPHLLARGGMATVWAARDRVLEREVAIKVLADALSHDPVAHQRFLREARAAAGLGGHPGIVTIYDIGSLAGRPFLVMALLPGGTVADRLRSGGRIDPRRVLRWIGEAARALDHAHAHGVVHRDVKPANMLLDAGDRVVLGDFGIARVAEGDALTQTGLILGTAGYLAPEVLRGGAATPASDRYALAMVAHELLSGERALEGRPSPLVPPAAGPVLVRGLADDPAQRWGTAGAFAEALEEALAAPDRTPPAPAPSRTEQRGGRRSLLPAAGTAALLAGAVAAVALASGGGSDRTPESARSGRTAQVRTSTATTTVTGRVPSGGRTAAATPPAPQDTGDLDSARAAQVAGYRARLAGDRARALELDHAALTACGDRRQLDPCGYALYELGLVTASDDPQAGLALLRRRLVLYGDNDRGEVAAAIADVQRRKGVRRGD